jgi:hypothetical protein
MEDIAEELSLFQDYDIFWVNFIVLVSVYVPFYCWFISMAKTFNLYDNLGDQLAGEQWLEARLTASYAFYPISRGLESIILRDLRSSFMLLRFYSQMPMF